MPLFSDTVSERQSMKSELIDKYSLMMPPMKPILKRSKNKKEPPKKKVKIFLYDHVSPKVDDKPIPLCKEAMFKKLQEWSATWHRLHQENIDLVHAISKTFKYGGKVDSHWDKEPDRTKLYYYNRLNFQQQINRENKFIYDRIITATPRIDTTKQLRKDWERNKRDMIEHAEDKFVLFPLVPTEDIEDTAFRAPKGVKRPRVYITLGTVDHGCLPMGELQIELFTDICPLACELFIELLMGDGHGYGYVGTTFFRKVPNLYWSGGDVVYDNGFGCYAQRGRTHPIGAENYHFCHTMPGLLSMRMTCDDEMCGIFNITFKPMPQFDYRNVVFGRVVRPSATYNNIQIIGNAVSLCPEIVILASRRRVNNKWIYGKKNNKVLCLTGDRKKLFQKLVEIAKDKMAEKRKEKS